MKTFAALLLVVCSAAAMAGQDCACCKNKKMTADERFLEQAQQMLEASEGKKAGKMSCCSKEGKDKKKAAKSVPATMIRRAKS